MKKNLIFVIILIALLAGFLLYKGLSKKGPQIKEITMTEKNLEGKKVAMIIAFRDFRDEEYFVPKEILETAGIEIKTASNKTGQAIGSDGGEVTVDLLVPEINPADFDAVVFIGGPGCLESLDNQESYRVAKETISKNRILASICISPVILAKAGVLKRKKATVWSSPLDRGPVRILKENEAIYEDKPVVVDGKIITANGPAAAKEFAEKIVEALR
jgi:protease I